MKKYNAALDILLYNFTSTVLLLLVIHLPLIWNICKLVILSLAKIQIAWFWECDCRLVLSY